MSTSEYKAKLMFFPTQKAPIDVCGCRYCENEWHRMMEELDPDGRHLLEGGMTVCKDCGCKRCPRASYHGHECTRSNDSGQRGSVYGDFELDTSWMGDEL